MCTPKDLLGLPFERKGLQKLCGGAAKVVKLVGKPSPENPLMSRWVHGILFGMSFWAGVRILYI